MFGELMKLKFVALLIFISNYSFAVDSTWIAKYNLPGTVNSLLFGKNGEVYTGTDAGVYYSKDDGRNWEILSSTRSNQIFIIDDWLFSYYKYWNSFEAINIKNHLVKTCSIPEQTSFVTPDKAGRIYLGTDITLYVSTDFGNTWNSLLELKKYTLNKMMIGKDGELFLNTSNSILSSTDDGANWKTIYTENNVSLFFADTLTGELYINTEPKGYRKTSDKGFTWELFTVDFGPKQLIKSQQKRTLFIEGNDYFRGIFKSADDGQTWEYLGLKNGKLLFRKDEDIYSAYGNSIFYYNPDFIPSKGKNYFPLDAANKWQYIYYREFMSNRYVVKTLAYNYQISIIKDSVIKNNRYYLFSNSSTDWYRYDQKENLIYLRYKDSDYVYMDFKLRDGALFNTMIRGYNFLYKGRIFEQNNLVFGEQRPSKGISWPCIVITNDGSVTVQYAENLGIIKDDVLHYLSGGYLTKTLIQAIIKDGEKTTYYSEGYKPIIEFYSHKKISKDSIGINYRVSHFYNMSCVDNPPFDFIDSVVIKSFYMKKDSIIYNKPINIYRNDWRLKIDTKIILDTTLINKGFGFYFRITAKDKGIIPGYSSLPDTGYFKLEDSVLVTGVDSKKFEYPTEYKLNQNYPNPFNSVTNISYYVPQQSKVKISVYDILGKKIAELVNEEKQPGQHETRFDCGSLASGIYYYEMVANNFRTTKKLLLLK